MSKTIRCRLVKRSDLDRTAVPCFAGDLTLFRAFGSKQVVQIPEEDFHFVKDLVEVIDPDAEKIALATRLQALRMSSTSGQSADDAGQKTDEPTEDTSGEELN